MSKRAVTFHETSHGNFVARRIAEAGRIDFTLHRSSDRWVLTIRRPKTSHVEEWVMPDASPASKGGLVKVAEQAL